MCSSLETYSLINQWVSPFWISAAISWSTSSSAVFVRFPKNNVTQMKSKKHIMKIILKHLSHCSSKLVLLWKLNSKLTRKRVITLLQWISSFKKSNQIKHLKMMQLREKNTWKHAKASISTITSLSSSGLRKRRKFLLESTRWSQIYWKEKMMLGRLDWAQKLDLWVCKNSINNNKKKSLSNRKNLLNTNKTRSRITTILRIPRTNSTISPTTIPNTKKSPDLMPTKATERPQRIRMTQRTIQNSLQRLFRNVFKKSGATWNPTKRLAKLTLSN